MQVLKKVEKLERKDEREGNEMPKRKDDGYSHYEQARITRLKLYVRECLVCHKRLKIDQECTHTSRRKLHKGEVKNID